MTHVPETGTIFWHRFLVKCVMHIWHWIRLVRLVPDSGAKYSKPGRGMHATEMMTYDWSIITDYVYVAFSHVYLPEIFIPDA